MVKNQQRVFHEPLELIDSEFIMIGVRLIMMMCVMIYLVTCVWFSKRTVD